MRPGEPCWSNGCCMARAMHGQAAAQSDLTPTPVDPTPVAKWCASSFNSRQQLRALWILADDAAKPGRAFPRDETAPDFTSVQSGQRTCGRLIAQKSGLSACGIAARPWAKWSLLFSAQTI